jgi:hypothetical protein
MSIKGYKIYKIHYKHEELVDTLVGTQPRKYLNELRKKRYIVRKIKR